MSEEKNVSKPLQLWNSAVKAVKGESTGQLVEQFTSEMTLVAEGLCEDQSRLRKAVDDLRREQDQIAQRLESSQQASENALREELRDIDRRFEDMQRRLTALENKQKARENVKKDKGSVISQLTVLAGIIAGAWIIVTVLNLFR